MNTGLGLSFWRIVNEEGSNGWAQIYARIPFDDAELKTKGALFGVVFGEDKENWADKDAELMSWVEEYFNGLDTTGDLMDFANKWKNKYPDLRGVWVWVNSKGIRRDLRLVRYGDTGIILTRKEKDFDLSKNLTEGKVLKGLVEEGDKLSILTGKLDKTIMETLSKAVEGDITKWNKELQDKGDAAAGLIFNFGKILEEESAIEVLPEKVEPKQEERTIYIPDIEVKRSVPELASEKFVGPIGAKEKISNWWLKIRPVKHREIVQERDTTKRRKWAMLVGVIFLVLLVVSLISGSIKMKSQSELKKWQGFSEPIEKSLQEANSLASINPTGAKKIIEDLRTQFDAGKGQFINSKYKNQLADLEKKINDTWTLASGEKESTIDEILRIDLVRQGYKGDRLSLLKDSQFLSLDSNMGVVMSLDTKSKDIKVVAGKGEGLGWLDIVGDGNKILVLNGSGIRNAETGADLVTFDAAVAKPIALGKFGTNIYVLDQGNKEIYKYAEVGENLGDRVRWLKQDQSIGLDPVDLAIDSDIWIASQNGKVERFRRGAKENFSINGLANDVKISRIAVQQNGTNLALLDTSKAVIYICSKDTGSCTQTLKNGKLLNAKDIEYDETGNLLVLYDGIVGSVK